MIIPLMNSLKKMILKLIILSGIIFCLGGVSCSLVNSLTPVKRAVAVQPLEKEEYDVLSAFLNQQEKNLSDSLIILLDKTIENIPVSYAGYDVGVMIKYSVTEKYPTALNALRNLEARINYPDPVERLFSIDKKYKLISEPYFKSFFNTSRSKAWQNFRAENEDVARVYGFSRVGFNTKRNVAIFYQETTGYESSGNFQVFVKEGISWRFIDSFGGYET